MTAPTLFQTNRRIDIQARLSGRLERLQAQVTGPRLSAPSDAPRDWASIATLDRQGTRLDAYGAAMAAGRSDARDADAALGAIGDALARARELVIARGGPNADGGILGDGIAAIRQEVGALMTATDAQGTATFPPGVAARLVPAGPGVALPTTPGRETVATIPRADGSSVTLDALFATIERAVRDGGDLSDALAVSTEAIGHISTVHGRHGLAMGRLDRAIEANGAAGLETAADRSRLADTDVAEAISRIQSQLVTLDAARATMVRINERTLFDLLR